ncbi:hypothetical protein OPV22_029086 [Ensete ventricosum]|uniref:Uncharacterized protein n=1 Tax=Ensete ventricosum TaxID=4639 RepID=A0AAV8Q5L8_ENSVE|nr:hypothetical protein OPV22_029086 [Ensete ventricosum]
MAKGGCCYGGGGIERSRAEAAMAIAVAIVKLVVDGGRIDRFIALRRWLQIYNGRLWLKREQRSVAEMLRSWTKERKPRGCYSNDRGSDAEFMESLLKKRRFVAGDVVVASMLTRVQNTNVAHLLAVLGIHLMGPNSDPIEIGAPPSAQALATAITATGPLA